MADEKDIDLKIRMPDGSTLTCSFPSISTLKDLNGWIAAETGEKNLLLSLSYPRKIYELMEQEKTTLGSLPGFNSGKGLLIAQRSISTTMVQDSTPFAKPGVIHVSSEAEYDKIRASTDRLVVVDFGAEWCGPCKKIAPVFEALAAATPGATFIHVDVDKVRPDDAEGVSGIPTFKFYKKKSLVHEFSGADQAQLQDTVSKYK